MTLPANLHINRPKFPPALLPEMRRLWEECPELRARAIGVLLGVTKNTVIGQAHRRGWKLRGELRSASEATMQGRLDALHADLDRVLVATTGAARPAGRPEKPAPAELAA